MEKNLVTEAERFLHTRHKDKRRTQALRIVAVAVVFVAIGSVTNTEFLDGKLELDQTGHIVAREMGDTSVPGVFAAGDVRTKMLRQVSTAVADGANCADACANYLLQHQS